MNSGDAILNSTIHHERVTPQARRSRPRLRIRVGHGLAGSAKVVTGCRLSPWTGNLALAPKTWTFQGSDDGAQWTELDSQSNVTNWTAAYNEYHFANSTAYRHYRLRITANNNNNAGCVCVAEMDLEGPLVGPEFRYDLEVTHQAGTTGRAAVWAACDEVDDVKDWEDGVDQAVSGSYDAVTGGNIVNQVASAYDGWCSGSPRTSTTARAAASPRSSARWMARTARTSAR